MLLLMLLACADGVPANDAADREAFLAALAAEPATARQRCGAIAAPVLAGDCWLGLAARQARAGDAAGARATCEAVPADVWRSECHFLVTDELDLLGEEAAAACRALPLFGTACLNHAAERELRHHLPLVEGEESAWLDAAKQRTAVYRIDGGPVRARRLAEDVLIDQISARWGAGAFDASRCGEVRDKLCAGAYAATLALEPSPHGPPPALCAEPRTLASVVAAGGTAWTPESEAIALQGLARACAGPGRGER